MLHVFPYEMLNTYMAFINKFVKILENVWLNGKQDVRWDFIKEKKLVVLKATLE